MLLGNEKGHRRNQDLRGTSSLPPLTFVARMTDVQRYGLFVGGEFVPAHSGATFPVHNPHNDEVYAQVAEAREDDVEDAIAAARSAFEGPWGALTPKERGKLLLRLARLIQDQSESISRLEAKNSGHPIRDVRRFDLVRTVDWFEYFAGMTTKIQGDVIPSSVHGVLNYTLRERLGVVAQIVPWNFPLMFVAWSIAPAAARCDGTELRLGLCGPGRGRPWVAICSLPHARTGVHRGIPQPPPRVGLGRVPRRVPAASPSPPDRRSIRRGEPDGPAHVQGS